MFSGSSPDIRPEMDDSLRCVDFLPDRDAVIGVEYQLPAARYGLFLAWIDGLLAGGDWGRRRLIEQETVFYSAQGYRLGEYFRALRPGRKVLVIADTGAVQWDGGRRWIDAFRKGYGSDAVEIGVPAPFQEEAGVRDPSGVVLTKADFDDVIAKHPDAGIIVSLFPPREWAADLKCLGRPEPPALAYVMAEFEELLPSRAADLIRQGKAAVLVIPHPEGKYDVRAPSDPRAAFDLRFVLVDRNNVETYAAKQP